MKRYAITFINYIGRPTMHNDYKATKLAAIRRARSMLGVEVVAVTDTKTKQDVHFRGDDLLRA
jgi:hypothetical protein